MRNIFNIKETTLFKIIMRQIILSRTCEDDNNYNNQYKSNKFLNNQFNRNQRSDEVRYFNKFEKNVRLNNYLNTQTSNKRAHTKKK